MQYGFAIDQRTCIGCHACTVACKTEHEVPLGQFRTWVKYVDQGTFPENTRDFGVMRCNHCTDAPCVKICPTKSLFKRPDGIVDFDGDKCIGCKSCMQACPYDAIYIDESTHTAAKCNFCAHRVDEGLEPACVVVCPTHSIWVGDVDDPTSGISKLINNNPTAVRSPEQNTGPNVFYLGADRAVLDPLAAPVDATYIFATPDPHRLEVSAQLAPDPVTGARTTLNTAHDRPWGWRVTTYLWTKGVGAGALMVAAALINGPEEELGPLVRLVAPGLATGLTAATGALLIWDLKRPDRFHYIFLSPNPSSWLFWGSVALAGYSAVSGSWLAAGLAQSTGLLAPATAARVIRAIRWAAVPSAGLAAGYTGFLFGQAEGRDLWQSPLLFWHLLVQAVQGGSGALLAIAGLLNTPAATAARLSRTFALSSGLNAGMLALEYGGRHPSQHAATAAHLATHGRYAKLFWGGAVGLGLLGGALGSTGRHGRHRKWAALGGLLAQAGLLAYESVFVRAGQDVPLS